MSKAIGLQTFEQFRHFTYFPSDSPLEHSLRILFGIN